MRKMPPERLSLLRSRRDGIRKHEQASARLVSRRPHDADRRKGISALQVKRIMGFGSYETAWSMCRKIRSALMEDIERLGGIVEVDETCVGGKNRVIELG